MTVLDALYEGALAEAGALKAAHGKPIAPHAKLSSEEGFVYHATNVERAHGVAEKGLKTHGPSWGTDQHVWPDGSREKRSYHSKSASVVWQFAPEEGPHVILRVKTDKHPFKTESGTGDIYTVKTIPPRLIEILLEGERWVSLKAWAS